MWSCRTKITVSRVRRDALEFRCWVDDLIWNCCSVGGSLKQTRVSLVEQSGPPATMRPARFTKTPRGICLAAPPAAIQPIICLPVLHSDTINNAVLILVFVLEILRTVTRLFIWFVFLFSRPLCPHKHGNNVILSSTIQLDTLLSRIKNFMDVIYGGSVTL